VDYCDAGYQWDPILSGYFYHFDPSSFTLTPLNYSGSSAPFPYPTSFFYYKGAWGDLQYEDSDPRQKTVPYFHFKRFTTGPTGPRAKPLVRKGLYPDQRHRKTWVEWLVAVYMSWYPCCLKGWRVWISVAVVIGALVFVTLGIMYAIRKYKKRGYEMVDTEIPMDDMTRHD